MALKKFGQGAGTAQGYSGGPSPHLGRLSSNYGQRIATLKYLPNGIMLLLEAPYNKDFTESLKKSLPTKKRIWDNNDKAWYVTRDQFERVTHLLDMYYDDTILVDFPAAQVNEDAWTKLYLVEGAPLALVRAAYKVLATMHHPDKGGDLEVMKTINIAYKEILGELKNGDAKED